MDAQQILQTDALDILFIGRNKDYGAYDLRKTYNKRILIALSATLMAVCFLIVIQTLANSGASHEDKIVIKVPDNTASSLPPEMPPPPPPPPPIKTLIPPTASIKFTTPEIVENEKVMAPPPEVKQLDTARIGTATIAGPQFLGVMAPPSEEISTQVIAEPVDKKEDLDKTRIIVEIEASFPGGPDAWARYVKMAIEDELGAFSKEDYGTVMVKFVVDRSGNVSGVHATNMRGTRLAEVAVNAIRNGPKWIPAQQNGHYVSAYRLQAVTLTHPNQ